MGAGVAAACVLAWLTALSVFDIRERRLPNWLTLPGAVVVLAVAAAAGRGVPAVLGAVGLAGLYLVVHLVAPSAMGAGDVKLAVGVGALTGAFGYDVWVLAAIAAPLLTATWACLALVRRQRTVPHGPSMCVATLVAATLAIF
jgi:leader peptidase (prepilin peptidase) / N-methyltransferase